MKPRDDARRIVIGDAHAVTRRGVRQVLERHGWEVVAEVADADDAVRAVAEHEPDISLLDVAMPGGGIAATAQIVARAPDALVVLLSVAEDTDVLLEALRVGASGFLVKDMNVDRLPFAMEGVLRGEAALPRWLVSRLVAEFRARGTRRRAPEGVTLSEREWEVLEALRDGLDGAETATRLSLSPVTVRRHLQRAVAKLGARDRADALQKLYG